MRRDRALVPALLLVALYGAGMALLYQAPDWDYRCNINAAELLRQGKSPYSFELGTRYLYPPPLAHALQVALGIFEPSTIFRVFQSAQVLLVTGAFLLLRELARRFGAGATLATALAAAITVLNFPMFYNLRHHQVNLVMLDAALLAMLFPRAVLSGLALAAGTQLKLYPALLLVPLWVFGHRRIAGWWLAGMAVPLAFAGVRRDWMTFLEMLPNLPKGEAVLDNSVTSLVERGLYAAGATPSIVAVKAAAGIIGIGLLGVAAARLARHAREGAAGDGRPFLRAMAEWSAAALFLSPIAWEQHFVIALPLVVILIVERPRHAAVLAGCALMLLLPRTPQYPFSHHYLAGLAALFAVSGTRRRV